MRPLVITGGGTGGHIFPMMAIADALETAGEQSSDLCYVGSRRGQEGRLLGNGPIALTLLPGRGIRRSMRPRAIIQNCGAVAGLLTSVVVAIVLVARWRPRAVVSVGGYASFPVAAAAVLWRRPLILVDLDASAPATHRVLQRFATRRCVAIGTTRDKTIVTGAPVRIAVSAIDRSATAQLEARRHQIPEISPDRQVVIVMTGSLGASSVNRAVVGLAEMWSDRRDITIIHVTGRRDEQWVRDATPALNGLDYRIVAFADMVSLWQIADVALCRAGATTIAELTAVGVASVLVPLPGAPGDHQGANARALQDAGAARVLNDSEVTPTSLATLLDALLAPGVAETMARAAKQLGRPDAAARIAAATLEVCA